MLDACHQARLGLEPPDEVRLCRELGMDLLDRDLAVDRRLDAAPDDGERAPTGFFEQSVAAQRAAGVRRAVERRIAAEQLLLQLQHRR